MRIIVMLCCLLLAGCSVTIDEAEPANHEQQTENVEQPPTEQVEQQSTEQRVEETQAVDEQPTQLFDFLTDFLPFSQSNTVHYLALGDSLTRGVGDEEKLYGFTGRLAAFLEEQPSIDEVVLDNRGKNGRRSDQLLSLLERGHYDQELAEADFITISLGGNDVMKVVRSDLFNLKEDMFFDAVPPFEARYRGIVASIRAMNDTAPIIFVGFYNPFALITDEAEAFEGILSAWNETIEQVAQDDVNACFVPTVDLFMSNDELVYHSDFFHPNAKGYANMTQRVIDYLQTCDIEAMSDGLIVIEE